MSKLGVYGSSFSGRFGAVAAFPAVAVFFAGTLVGGLAGAVCATLLETIAKQISRTGRQRGIARFMFRLRQFRGASLQEASRINLVRKKVEGSEIIAPNIRAAKN